MNLVVISDLHLGKRFDQWRYEQLTEIISQVDRVILNGDFWEGFAISFDTFVNSEWKKLFPLLKAKHTIYLYGNHDPANLSDERANLFSDEQKLEHTETIEGMTYHFEHGQRYCRFPEAKVKRSRITKARIHMFHAVARVLFTRPAGPWERHFSRRLNKRIKRGLRTHDRPIDVYVCGHTHAAEIDLDNRFVNSGSCCYAYLQYLMITDGVIQPKTVVRCV